MTTAIILAAGRGERMRPLTDTTAKPLLKVAGKPLIEHHLLKLAAAGCERVVINLCHFGEQIRRQLGDGQRFGVPIFYSDECEQRLETAGGICKALPLLGEQPFWVINGDIWTELEFEQLPNQLNHGDLGHLLMVANPEHHPIGDFGLAQGRLTQQEGARLTYSGLALLSPELFAGLPVGFSPLAPLLKQAIAADRMAGSQITARWCDVGTPQRLQQLNETINKEV